MKVFCCCFKLNSPNCFCTIRGRANQEAPGKFYLFPKQRDPKLPHFSKEYTHGNEDGELVPTPWDSTAVAFQSTFSAFMGHFGDTEQTGRAQDAALHTIPYPSVSKLTSLRENLCF